MTAIVRPPAPVPAGPAPWTDGLRPIEGLWEASSDLPLASVRGGRLPADLAARFGARLEIPLRADRPTIAVNFVSTLDGVVALDRAGATGGREISGGFEPDRFLMGLLRATADAVLVGAGTVRASRTHAWTPARVHPASAAAFAGWRGDLGLTSAAPTTVVVSASGDLDGGHLDLTDPDVSFVVATTADGARRLRSRWPSDRVEVVPVAEGGRLPIDGLLGLLRERGYGLVLSEGGPTLFAELLAARAVDELFLTVAPQLAGRVNGNDRLSLVEGVSFVPGIAPWATLRSVMRSEDHLFLRYGLADRGREGVS
ncbi:MAG TPA: dihydrofolate reductase family protein [Candidatus Limnocylindrales bacterium]|nr:dihydrofolate reductase family protein [Candidatus Limnocylindrales bacterium]